MILLKSILCYVIVVTLVTDSLQAFGRSPFGPPYPITESWFKDRYPRSEWDAVLGEFSKIGGDTVFQRAPPIIIGSMNELTADSEFKASVDAILIKIGSCDYYVVESFHGRVAIV